MLVRRENDLNRIRCDKLRDLEARFKSPLGIQRDGRFENGMVVISSARECVVAVFGQCVGAVNRIANHSVKPDSAAWSVFRGGGVEPCFGFESRR